MINSRENSLALFVATGPARLVAVATAIVGRRRSRSHGALLCLCLGLELGLEASNPTKLMWTVKQVRLDLLPAVALQLDDAVSHKPPAGANAALETAEELRRVPGHIRDDL